MVFLKQSWYYDFFNIQIQQYISVDEIFILFLNEVSFIVKIIIYLLIYHVLIHLIFLFIFRKDKDKSQYAFYEEVGLILDSKNGVKIYFILTLIILFVSLCFFFYNKDEISLTIVTSASFVFAIISLELFEFKSTDYTFLIASIISIAVLLFLKNEKDVKETFDNRNNISYSFSYKNKVFKTGKNYIYLGKTKEYIYLYNKQKKSSYIIKSEEVKEISIMK